MMAIHPAMGDLLEALPDTTLIARSCKVSAHGMSSDRLLCSLGRSALAPAAGKRFLALAEAFLGQPCAPLAPYAAQARAFHFALDPADAASGAVRKAYAEMEADPDRDLVYIALKSTSGSARLTSYLRRNLRQTLDLLHRMRLPSDLTRDLAALCRDLGQEADVDFLEVREDLSPRLSLDLNLSDVPATPDLRHRIEHLVRLIHPAALPSCWPVTGLSHVAIGQSAAGAPFITLYGYPEPTQIR